MKKLTKTDHIIIVVLLLLAAGIAISFFAPAAIKKASKKNKKNDQVSNMDYNGKTIGSAVGTTYDQAILKNLPDAKLQYYSSYGDMIMALNTGKIDAFCVDEPVIRYMMTENDTVDYIKEKLETYDFGVAFPKSEKGNALCDEFSDFVKEKRADGTLDELDKKWFGGDSENKKPADLSSLTGEKDTLSLAICTDSPPFTSIINGEPAGYEVDLIYLFCKERGYGLQYKIVNFEAIMPALQSGICDFGTCSMTISEERKESVNFAEPHYAAGAVLAIPASSDTAETGKGLIAGLKESFIKTFVREDRWKMILHGLGTTCLITLLSTFFGTLLAFLLCMFRRTDSLLAEKIVGIYVKILQGTPMVVLLMILYYVIFAKTSLSGIVVAVIGFTLNFGAYVSEIMYTNIESIDAGQREAALALGFSENESFLHFIFPQAAVRFLPVYRGEVVSLLKSTSIVGYIAVQDLTKMTDIIRSRTYEAFFPLIATAIIYFALSGIIVMILDKVLRRIDPRKNRRKKKKAAVSTPDISGKWEGGSPQ